MQNRRFLKGGFALPTVLIASVVMLTILTVSVSSVAAVRTALKSQYYEQLAQVAGEAGVAYAKACLAKNGNVPQWTNAAPLKPNTDCSGVDLAGVACPADAGCSVMKNGPVMGFQFHPERSGPEGVAFLGRTLRYMIESEGSLKKC